MPGTKRISKNKIEKVKVDLKNIFKIIFWKKYGLSILSKFKNKNIKI